MIDIFIGALCVLAAAVFVLYSMYTICTTVRVDQQCPAQVYDCEYEIVDGIKVYSVIDSETK